MRYNKEMKCKNCGKDTEQIKDGKTKAGRQKYKCKHCGIIYTPNPKKGPIVKKSNMEVNKRESSRKSIKDK